MVILNIEMGLESRNTEMDMDKKKTDKKKNEGDDGEAKPAPVAKMLVPGVPMPKSVTQMEEDRGGSSQEAGGQMQQKKTDVRTVIKKLIITILYDKRIPSDKLMATKQAIVALMKVNENQMIFTPTTFTETVWQQVLTPKWLIPLALAIWLLLFLWGPLASFFRHYINAMKQHDENMKIDQKTEEEAKQEEETDGDEEGEGGGGEGEGEGEIPPEELEEEEAMKKFEPFTYVTEENLRGLAYLLRKEEPWIIALVLTYLKPEFAKEVFASFPPELQARVAVETATIRQTSLEQVMAIDEYIKKKIDFVLGGLENLIKILNETDKTTRENILDYLRNEKPSLYERLRDEIFLFEDLLKFPDQAVQIIVREVGTDSLSRALRGASPEYMNKFFMNMSAGAAALVKEAIDYGRPLTPEQVDEERKKLLDVISKADREGKINVRKRKKMNMLEGEEADDNSDGLNLNDQKPPAPIPAASAVDVEGAMQLFQAAVQSYDMGQYPQAVQNLHLAIQSNPDLWQAYQYLGNAYYAQGMWNEAIGSYERMLELNPKDAALRTWVDGMRAQMGTAAQGSSM